MDARAPDGGTVTTTRSDANGDYRLTLATGQYTLVVVTSNGFPRCPNTALTVTDGPPTRTDISCDTGIR